MNRLMILALLFALNSVTNPARAAGSCSSVFDAKASLNVGPVNEMELRELASYMGQAYGFALRQYGAAAQTGIYDAAVLSKFDQRAQELHETLKAFGGNYRELLVDPALMQNFDRFVSFTKKHPSEDGWEARAAFLAKDEPVTVYRALVLNDAQTKSILMTGLDSGLLRQDYRGDVASFWGPSLMSFRRILESHIQGRTNVSPFLSVSSYPELAAAVAQARLPRDAEAQGLEVVVFEVRTTKATLLAHDANDTMWSIHDDGLFVKNPWTVKTPSGSKTFPDDRTTESFMVGRIGANQLRVIDTPPTISVSNRGT